MGNFHALIRKRKSWLPRMEVQKRGDMDDDLYQPVAAQIYAGQTMNPDIRWPKSNNY